MHYCSWLSGVLFVAAALGAAPGQLQNANKTVVFDWHVAEKKASAIDKSIESAGQFEAGEVKANPEAIARKILSTVGRQLMGISEEAEGREDVNKYLRFERSFDDQLGDTTMVFRQTFEGIPVYGSDVRVHVSSAGTPRAITSKFLPGIQMPTTVASVSPRQAVEAARRHSEQPEKLQKIPPKAPELVICYIADKYRLAWLLELPGVEKLSDGTRPARWRYFIDAEEGSVLSRYNDLKFQSSAVGHGKGVSGSDRFPLYVTQLGSDLFVLQDMSMPGPHVRTYDFEYKDLCLEQLPGELMRNNTNEWNRAADAPGVDAHYFARNVFEYYWTVHGRNSLDNKGMDLVSSIRSTYWCDSSVTNHKWNNAMWTGSQMAYGDGDGTRFGPFSGGLDIVAHEFTHGITENTAGLEYRNQSGALNESYSDVFAKMIDTSNWEIGRDIMLPRGAGSALRSLADPPRFGQPDHMRRYVVTDQDNGGVHINSGIPNKVAYLLAAGGTHNNVRVRSLGRETTAQIYYLTLMKYLSPLSDFEDARRQTLKAVMDLYPGDQEKREVVSDAFASVGIGTTSQRGEVTEPSIVIAAYGDTRTGFWGLGDNYQQSTHAKVVDQILASATPDAVIFTGDAVMTNFPLWRKQYWRYFLAQTDRFIEPRDPSNGRPRIAFYPSLGNHETYRSVPLVIDSEPPAEIAVSQSSAAALESSISQIYDRGEESALLRSAAAPGRSTIDMDSTRGADIVSKWGETLAHGSNVARAGAAFQLGQMEGRLQENFYAQDSNGRCNTDGRIFKNAYLDLAGYTYLDSLISGVASDRRRSYYSVPIIKGDLKVKLIALDTNCLDYPPQQQFFQREATGFDGSIIVFGHHPPTKPTSGAVAPWDNVRGWDFYQRFLTSDSGKNVRLWVLGHVHNYQRRNSLPNSQGSQLSPPVIVIAGGGGASDLNASEASIQWQPNGWQAPVVIKAYNYIQITITQGAIHVDAYGSSEKEKAFTLIDSFTIRMQ